jgi:hypothetical protein
MKQTDNDGIKKKIVSEITQEEFEGLREASDRRKSSLSSTIRFAVSEYLRDPK